MRIPPQSLTVCKFHEPLSPNDPISKFHSNYIFSGTSLFCPFPPKLFVQFGEKTNGKVLRFIVKLWSATNPQLGRKWHQLAGSEMSTMAMFAVDFSTWFSRNGPLGSVRGGADSTCQDKLPTPTTTALSSVSTCHSADHS